MNITVLGGKGQIGTYLCDYLKQKGHLVYNLDIAKSKEDDLRIHNNRVVEECIADSDFVYFLAFDVGGSRYLDKYQHTYQFVHNNVQIMANVFELLKKYRNRFIFASSQMSNMSYSPYGILKAVGESYTKALGGRIVKFWNVYGVEEDLDKAHVITDFILSGIKHRRIQMLTDGKETRQFLYAQDCCDALNVVAENYLDFTPEDELHITSFENTRIIDVAKIVQDLFHLDGEVVEIIPGELQDTVQKDKKNEPSPYICKWWHPTTPLKEGIANIYKAEKENVVV